ncbi:hypothetical protein BDS110ZK1_13720 [Bradyrhizobium diazoefficiens]
MKCLALLCLLVLAAPAHAATPEQRYLELRDRYIAKFSKAAENDETSRQHDAALNELAGVLRGLVGPVAIKGLPAEGKSNADTLFKGDSGFGHLDGLGFASEGDKLQAVVTTMALLKHWLREHREDGMPQETGAAFKSDRFYYQAIQDSAFAKYAELPVTKPASASAAVAVLGVRGNGDLKGPPHEIRRRRDPGREGLLSHLIGRREDDADPGLREGLEADDGEARRQEGSARRHDPRR